MTKQGRAKRVREALAAYNEKRGDKETAPLPWRGRQDLFPVVELDLDVVLLNANSHRLQAMLGDHPKLSVVKKEPWGEDAQETLADLLRKPSQL